MPLTVRVDVKTQRLLQRLARKRGGTKSDLIRTAIGMLARQVEAEADTDRPYDKVRDLLGSVQGGPADLSVRTGEAFRQMLSARRSKTSR